MTIPYAAAMVPPAAKAGHVKGHTFFVRHRSDPGHLWSGTSTSSMDVTGDADRKAKHRNSDRCIEHPHQRGQRLSSLQLGARDSDALGLKQPTSWKADDGFWRHRSHPAPYAVDVSEQQRRLPRVLATRLGYARQPRRTSPPQAHRDVAHNSGVASTIASSPVLPAARSEHCRKAQDELGERLQTLENIFGSKNSVPPLKKISHRIESLAQPRKDIYHEPGLQIINSLSEDDLDRPIRRPPRRTFRVPTLPKRYCKQDEQGIPHETTKKTPLPQSAAKAQTQSKKGTLNRKDVCMAKNKVNGEDEITSQFDFKNDKANVQNEARSTTRSQRSNSESQRSDSKSQRSDSKSRSASSSETESDRPQYTGSSVHSRTSHVTTPEELQEGILKDAAVASSDTDDNDGSEASPKGNRSFGASSTSGFQKNFKKNATADSDGFEVTPKGDHPIGASSTGGFDKNFKKNATADSDGFEVTPKGEHSFGASSTGGFDRNFKKNETADSDGFEVTPKGNHSFGASSTGGFDKNFKKNVTADSDGFEVTPKGDHSFGASNIGGFQENFEKDAMAASGDAGGDDAFEVSPKENHSFGASNTGGCAGNSKKHVTVAAVDAGDDHDFEVSPKGNRSFGASSTGGFESSGYGSFEQDN